MKSQNMIRYNYSVLQDPSLLKYEIYSFLKVVSTMYSFSPYQSSRLEYLFNATWELRRDLFNNTFYENVLIGIADYVLQESQKKDITQSYAPSAVKQIWSDEKFRYHITQVYQIKDLINELVNGDMIMKEEH